MDSKIVKNVFYMKSLVFYRQNEKCPGTKMVENEHFYMYAKFKNYL